MKTIKRLHFGIIAAFIIFINLVSINEVKAQVPSSYTEGHFYKDNSNGKVYWFAKGALRHVESAGTLNGLFSNATSYMFISNSLGSNAPIGAPLTADNGLINDVNTGKVYFRRGNYIHYITTLDAFHEYHFSMAAVTNVSSISSYIQSCKFGYVAAPEQPLPCNW